MIDAQDDLDRLVEHLASQPVFGIDCEMDSMYAYGTSLCLVQLGWPGGEALVDGLAPLDRSGLGALFADPARIKVFHGGENDIGLMRARWGLQFATIFDTMAASQVLGHEGVGLAAALKRHFDVHVSKKYQKADWRVRPLPDEQDEYARLDVRYLVPLREQLLAELERLGRVEEAESEFARIASACIEEKPFDCDNWVRIKGARELPPEQRAVLRAVYVARDVIARRVDRAPYRVMHDSGLLALARSRPRTPEQYRHVKGVNRRLPAGDVDLVVSAVRQGLEQGEIPLPRRSGSRRPWDAASEARLTPEQGATLDALRAWRTRRAARRGVDVARVATTALLAQVARAEPTSLDELARIDGFETWRLREYGDDILRVVRESVSSRSTSS